ncbi:hypothetical protein BC829DRAFT_390850 [Chytridium lagenaria]|nr:hypothetical protein BC829DRAFT_390850 [Chytridium lagenaria]
MSVRITLAEGVVGGFMPAVPRRFVILDVEDGHASIEHHVLKPGTREEYIVTKTAPTESLKSDLNTLVGDVLSGFKALPIEGAGPVEMIFMGWIPLSKLKGLGSAGKTLLPGGCNRMDSSVHPTDEQKRLFQSTVHKIVQLATSHATVAA